MAFLWGMRIITDIIYALGRSGRLRSRAFDGNRNPRNTPNVVDFSTGMIFLVLKYSY